MGLFRSLAGIIGQTPEQVLPALQQYAQAQSGALLPATLDQEHPDRCVVSGVGTNTTIAYPPSLLEWDECSAYLSRHLQAAVFSFHIHDGDLWMFLLFHKGELVTQFNPIPDYWDEAISPEEAASWQADVEALCQYVPYLQPSQVNQYFQLWDLEDEHPGKAYAQDEYERGDEWQLLDLMRTLKLPYPLAEPMPVGSQQFRFKTKHEFAANPITPKVSQERPWWKFW